MQHTGEVGLTRNNRLVLVAVALLVAVVGAWSSRFWLTLDSRLPTDDDYRSANVHITQQSRDGDVIVLAPSWATRGRDFLDAAPVFATVDLATDDFPDTKRQWLVALADAPRVDLEKLRNQLKTRSSGTDGGRRIGGLWVEAFEIPGPVTRFRLLPNVAQASVSLEGAKSEPCRWDAAAKKHQCPRGGWNAVNEGWFDVGGQPFHALWAHPVDGAELVLKWRGVPTQGRLRLRGSLTSLVALEGGEPVQVRALVDGREIGTLEAKPPMQKPADAWLELPGTSPDATGVLELRVSARRAGRRHFALDGYVATH